MQEDKIVSEAASTQVKNSTAKGGIGFPTMVHNISMKNTTSKILIQKVLRI